MTGFAIGMLAAAMWLGVMVAVWYLFKTAPGHPFRSIGRFRWSRRRLARISAEPVPEPEAIELPLTPREVEPVTSEEQPPASIDLAQPEPEIEVPVSIAEIAYGVDPGMETIEIDELIGAVTAPKKPRKPRLPSTLPRGPRKQGRTTYVLVDDEGRPLV